MRSSHAAKPTQIAILNLGSPGNRRALAWASERGRCAPCASDGRRGVTSKVRSNVSVPWYHGTASCASLLIMNNGVVTFGRWKSGAFSM